MNEIRVILQQDDTRERIYGALFVGIFLAILVVTFIKWILVGLAVGATAWFIYAASRERRETEGGLRARADQQDRWVYEGDERGTYGDWNGSNERQQP